MNENNDMLQSMIVAPENQFENDKTSEEAVSPPSALSKEDQEENTAAIDDLLSFQNSEQQSNIMNTQTSAIADRQNFEEDDEEFDIFAESQKNQIDHPLRVNDISASTIDQSVMMQSVNNTPIINKIINNNLSMSTLNEVDDEKIKKVRNYMLNGKFAEMVSSVQQYILALDEEESDMNMLLNICLIFGFIKLKEFKNARQLSKQCIQKLSKSSIFGFSTNDDGSENVDDNIPFSLKFMSAICLYLESNSRFKQKTLIELYQI